MDINAAGPTDPDYEARVGQLLVTSLPDDLYVPPQAFAILLEEFEGPLDFLLYLVRKNGFDLVHTDIAPVAAQYLAYLEEMQQLDVELAGDYMVMAALLADIKSRLLLPRPEATSIEEDPRQQLAERLETYARLKDQATLLGQQDILERDVFAVAALPPEPPKSMELFDNELHDISLLVHAMRQVLARPKLVKHQVAAETVSLEERVQSVIKRLGHGGASFQHLLNPEQGALGVVVTFMAILELLRQQKICLLNPQTIDDNPDASGDNSLNNTTITFQLRNN